MAWRAAIVTGIGTLGLMGLCAGLSYRVTQACNLGGFPGGEFRLAIRDPEGQPIPNARLRIEPMNDTAAKSRLRLSQYPPANVELLSDETGQITFARSGFKYSSTHWDLFFLIPIDTEFPEYKYVVSAPGFKTFEFPLRQFAQRTDPDAPRKMSKVKTDFGEIEFEVFERTVHLQR